MSHVIQMELPLEIEEYKLSSSEEEVIDLMCGAGVDRESILLYMDIMMREPGLIERFLPRYRENPTNNVMQIMEMAELFEDADQTDKSETITPRKDTNYENYA